METCFHLARERPASISCEIRGYRYFKKKETKPITEKCVFPIVTFVTRHIVYKVTVIYFYEVLKI